MSEITPYPENLPAVLPQELARFTSDGLVAMAMTGRAFDEAQQAGVIAISPHLENVRAIAYGVQYANPGEPLPPTLLFVRSTSENGKYIGHWDDRWPVHAKQPQTGMYFSAASVGEMPANYGSMGNIMEYAEAIGASAITEVCVPSWDSDATYIGALAVGLTLGQRAIRPPEPPSLLNRAATLFSDNKREQAAKARAEKLDHSAVGEPFIITYRGQYPALPLAPSPSR
jgi:hypothetical protein